jgi:putative ATPase
LVEVPKHLRSSNYAGAESYGNGVGYDYPHDHNPPVVKQEYVGGKAALKSYYLPKSAGSEEPKVGLWASLRKIIRGK